MSNIIYSIKQTDFTTIITTKSGIVKVYKFNTIEENNKFYESHSQKYRVIPLTIKYQINKLTTFIKSVT